MINYTPQINKAIKIAATLHEGQFRKGSTTPYIAHPYAVALMTQNYIDDESTFIAAILHDVLEDVPNRVYTAENMVEDFGRDITNIVETVTEPDIHIPTPEAWHARKNAYIANLQGTSDIRPLIVSACDKLHNMGELILGHEEHGSEIWNYFHARRDREYWFYETVLETFKSKVIPQEIIDLYTERLEKLRSLD